MNRKASVVLLQRRDEIEAATTARNEIITSMLKQRALLFDLYTCVTKWIDTVEEIERLSQGNPTLKSYREARSRIKSEIESCGATLEELDKDGIPEFNAVKEAIQCADVILEEDQPGSNAEELRFILGKARGTLQVIMELLYN